MESTTNDKSSIYIPCYMNGLGTCGVVLANRCSVAAWQKGQYVLQPRFTKSDQQFTTEHLLSSAALASDQGGNEQTVNICKRSGILQHGLPQNGSTGDLDNAWLAWNFQANFMYKPVL
jgi:hypothetical protein